MENALHLSLRVKLYEMKRDWLSFVAEAEARGDLNEARAFQAQLEQISSMLESIGADPAEIHHVGLTLRPPNCSSSRGFSVQTQCD